MNRLTWFSILFLISETVLGQYMVNDEMNLFRVRHHIAQESGSRAMDSSYLQGADSTSQAILTVVEEDGRFFREDYNLDGCLTQRFEVSRRWQVDTVVVFSPETYEEMLTVQAYYKDQPVGTYREYWPCGALWIEGQFSDGYEVGRWKIYHPNGALAEEVEIDRYGRRIGEFIRMDSVGAILLKGKTASFLMEVQYATPLGELGYRQEERLRKCGTWLQRDPETGELKEVVQDRECP